MPSISFSPVRRLTERTGKLNYAKKGHYRGGGANHDTSRRVLMSLREKLEATRAASASRVPADKRAIMERATADLRASGILKNVAAVGQVAPAFTAPDYDGRVLSSHELLARGPLVISFFRGAW
jgi:hypothetical protein